MTRLLVKARAGQCRRFYRTGWELGEGQGDLRAEGVGHASLLHLLHALEHVLHGRRSRQVLEVKADFARGSLGRVPGTCPRAKHCNSPARWYRYLLLSCLTGTVIIPARHRRCRRPQQLDSALPAHAPQHTALQPNPASCHPAAAWRLASNPPETMSDMRRGAAVLPGRAGLQQLRKCGQSRPLAVSEGRGAGACHTGAGRCVGSHLHVDAQVMPWLDTNESCLCRLPEPCLSRLALPC